LQSLKPLRIMIVDHHKGVRLGLKTYLESHVEFELIAEASNGCEAISHYVEEQPDLVLIGLFLPDTSGINLMHNLHLVNSQLPVIILTTSISPHLTKAVLIAGAAGVVNKDIDGQALALTIREAMGEIESNKIRSRSTKENIDILGQKN
jgi:DNA-binding NarL/FixJ family response regulator